MRRRRRSARHSLYTFTSRAGGEGGKSEELFGRKGRETGIHRERERERESGRSLSLPQILYWVCYCECVHCSEVLFTMAGSVFGRLSLEEGDSANSLEGLEIKLGGEGKNTGLRLLGV